MTVTGGSANYYKIRIDNPTTASMPYTAEINDIIEALGMTYAEGNVFKAVVRHALARQGRAKPGNTQMYEAQKALWFSLRLVAQAEGDE